MNTLSTNNQSDLIPKPGFRAEKRHYISPSQLKNVLDCEGKYEGRYIKQLPNTPFGEQLVCGSVIDELFTSFFQRRVEGLPDEWMDLEQIDEIYRKERDRAAETGADWMFSPKWKYAKRQDTWLNFLDLGRDYVNWFDSQGFSAVSTQKEIEGVIEGEKYFGIVDLVYQRPDGNCVIVDWKLQKQRSALKLDHHLQVSIYAFMTGTWDLELHYLVPYGRKIGWRIHEVKPLSREFILALQERRNKVHRGDVALNPSSKLCSPKFCVAWYDCPAGEARYGESMP